MMEVPGLGTASPEPAKSTPKAPAADEVVNDKEPKKRQPKAKVEPEAPAEEATKNEEGGDDADGFTEEETPATENKVGREIPVAEYSKLAEGTKVWAKLNAPGEEGQKYWEAKVEGYAKGTLSLFFLEDSTSLELVNDDRIYEYLG